MNQWRSTQEVLSWFKNIQNKQKNHFIQFDIVEFYPSITEQLLCEALDWAESQVNISKLDREIILAAKSTLLYNDSVPWCKQGNQRFFDVTMGSYDGAETCELVGLYILFKLGILIVIWGFTGMMVLDVHAHQRDRQKTLKNKSKTHSLNWVFK